MFLIAGCRGQNVYDSKTEYYSNGGLKFIKRYHNGVLHGQAIWFYPSGVIQESTIFKEGVWDGPCYKYYPSGSLESYRFYKNNKETNIGLDYYDGKLLLLKNLLNFNDSGVIYYSKTFDDHGNLISEKGKRPW